jgi:hypothetical protein
MALWSSIIPKSREEGWTASRRQWQDEYRANNRRFKEFDTDKVIYDYGRVRTCRVTFLSKNPRKKIALMKRVGKWLLTRGYKLAGAGFYETERFQVEIVWTPTRAILKTHCRRVRDEA